MLAANTAEGVEAWGGGIFNDTGSTLNLAFSLLTANKADGDATPRRSVCPPETPSLILSQTNLE